MLFEPIIGIAIIIDTAGTTTITDITGVTIIIIIGTGAIITGVTTEIAMPRVRYLCGNSGVTLLGAIRRGRPLAARLYRVDSEC